VVPVNDVTPVLLIAIVPAPFTIPIAVPAKRLAATGGFPELPMSN